MSGRVVDRVAPMKRIIGVSPWAEYVRSTVFKLAPHRSTVLITGPSGTGKELIAQAIHARSPRAAGPLVPVDLAAVPANLFAAQLFGYVKGAFSGANCDTLGCFRAADGGTIFLDEIGELSLEVQSQLLRVVESGSLSRWVAIAASRWTCGSSPPPTGTWRRKSVPAASAWISTAG